MRTLSFKLRSFKIIGYLFPIIVGLTFLLIMGYVLNSGHLHEDAYMMFCYTDNVAAGDGIAYYKGGPRSEGATDFLWMILIGMLSKTGIDGAWAAALLNMFGTMILASIIQRTLWRNGRQWVSFFLSALFGFLLVISPISEASYHGFSTAFYTGFIALLFYLEWQDKNQKFIPYVALIIGLIRPDGVIIGVTATLITISRAFLSKKAAPLLLHCGVAFVVGCLYFGWRYHYFGLLLPLPLYVKSLSDTALPGFFPNCAWLLCSRWLLIPCLLLVAFKKKQSTPLILASLPACALLVALAFATQTQNVAYRFQAPATTVLLILSAYFFGTYAFFSTKKNVRALSIVGISIFALGNIAIFLPMTKSMIQNMSSREYINYFPYYLNQYLSDQTRIAMTEAGRMAYWTKGIKYDLGGLNTKEIALNGPSLSFLEEAEPDLIFIHTAGTLPRDLFVSDYREISNEDFAELVRGSTPSWSGSTEYIYRSPIEVYNYLKVTKAEYKIVFAKYHGHDVHMYAIRVGGRISYSNFIDALKHSYSPEAHLSYCEMKRKMRTL